MSEPISNTTIDALSDKELFTIFNFLPVADLMRVTRVCNKWKFIHRVVCRSKTELTLYHPSYKCDIDDIHSLWYWSQSLFATRFEEGAFCVKTEFLFRRHINLLLDFFPNVRIFNLYGISIRIKHFALLMKQWPNMEQLTLAFSRDLAYEWKLQDWNIFWAALNPLKSLKHLALPYECGLPKLLFPQVMSRLESLYIIIGYDEGCHLVTELFSQIPPTLKNLALGDLDGVDHEIDQNYFDLNIKLKRILLEKPQIFKQLTQLGFHFEAGSGVDLPLLTFITTHFTGLTHLDLNIEPFMQLAKMLPLLDHLRLLTCLRLSPETHLEIEFSDHESTYEESITGDYEPYFPANEYQAMFTTHYKDYRSFGFFEGLSPKKHSNMLSIKLETVRCLHLANFDFFRWEQFDALRAVFPNIEKLHFENSEFFLIPKNSRRKKRRCRLNRRQLLLRYLKRFTALRQIFRNNVLLLDLTKLVGNEETQAAIDGPIKKLFKRKKRIHFADYSETDEDLDDYDSDLELIYDNYLADLFYDRFGQL